MSPTTPTAVSVVVPVYCSPDTLPELHQRVVDTAAAADLDVELVLVDDASPDDSWRTIVELARTDARVRGLRLGRNSGQHRALLAGFRHARHDVVVTLDDDLQHPPEDIPALLAALEGDVDLVYGTPREIAALGLRSVLGREAKRVVGAMVGLRGTAQITSFRAIRRHLIDLLPPVVDRGVMLDSIFGWYTDNVAVVPVGTAPRPGRSRYRIVDFPGLLLDGAITYGAGRVRPLLVAGLGLTATGTGVALWRGRPGAAPSGTGGGASDGLLLAAAGLQMVGLGIMAEHVQRVQVRTAGQLPYWVRETTDEPAPPAPPVPG